MVEFFNESPRVHDARKTSDTVLALIVRACPVFVCASVNSDYYYYYILHIHLFLVVVVACAAAVVVAGRVCSSEARMKWDFSLRDSTTEVSWAVLLRGRCCDALYSFIRWWT